MFTGIIVTCLLFQSFFVSSACAEIYFFVDGQGIIHISNVPCDSHYRLYQKGSHINNMYIHRKHEKAQPRDECAYDKYIRYASRKYGIDFAFLKALIKVESDYDPYAISYRGAKGLMQLMPQTCLLLKVRNPFDPLENIYGGTHYLRMLLDEFNGNLVFAIAAYNAGPQMVLYYEGVPPFSETRNYVNQVMELFQKYKYTLNKP